MRRELPRCIGFWGGSAIMVGIIIGSGIFRTPASIADEMGNPGIILLMWLVGGLLSLFGAFTYAELGVMFPRSGGIYVYLYEGLGEVVAFIFGWTFMFLGKPLAAASITMVFSEHLNRLLGVDWDPRYATCAVLILFTAINTAKVQLGAGMAIVFTGLKVLALILIVMLGLGMTASNYTNLAPVPAPKSLLFALAPVLAAVLWTYDGWSDVASCAGEVRDPQRNLPRILVFGTGACIILYLAVNTVYMAIVPLEEMRHVEKTVAPLVMERLVGGAGDTLVTLIVLISTLGATHGSIITGARVTFAQAHDGLLFKSLARVHPTWHTPDVSLWVQALMSCIGVMALGRFERMINGFVFTMWIFYALAAAAVIILRIRRPELPRPYRCWGYPFVPIAFILATAFMTVLSIRENPRDTLIWLGVLAAGVPTYYVWRRFVPKEEAAAAAEIELQPLDTKTVN
ncbi:MAG TPA: amino acid permease [Phycisphaerae bacterium]|jgi:APA family basic amino acid/polyamine antiporter|nr:amino acid permease [Phycisphaerae bacterium]HOJ53376.1 amino acid permease [Phycisphaerae bacterium]HOL25500.1 amino acid permease [Phycisphaerae bacterium]HPP19823.1 amino acid permease [Phycisphaerae bacterium]HPU31251.1 amino acid permease [Phycisphaerae bacterium]